MKMKLLLTSTAVLALVKLMSAAEISLESAPPVVVKTVPVAGATNVDPSLTEISVTYSKAMQDASWSWSTWGEENYPETTGKPKYMADNRTCVLPVKLQPEKFYAIWLNSDKFKNFKDTSGRAAVPYLLTFFTGAADSGKDTAMVTQRTINRLVSDFPAGVDLSTPETACAAWQRANAAKDAEAICKLSWIPLDAKEEEAWFQRQQSRDAEGLKIYLQAIAESKIAAVQIYRDDLASVITYLPFPEGKGRAPYSSRTFGRINGEWKNLGEDRLPDLEAAKANFERKKEVLWQQFSELKAKVPAENRASSGWEQLLNEDQRAVLAWTDRQFRSFFDDRSFADLSAEERSSLETRLLDTLNGPQTPEYYRAINTLGALRSTKALPRLRGIAFERVDRNNRDRWMCVRVLGLMDDRESVPNLIHLVYHGNQNTHWWAQISLVRLTGQNFGGDWNAWGDWWNKQNGQPPFAPEIIRWWSGQPEPDKLADSLKVSDAKFLNSIKTPPVEVQTGEVYLREQTRLAEAGNYWSKFNLWQAYSQGSHGVTKSQADADKWLAQLVEGAYLAKFEPVNGFNPRTPSEMLDEFSAHCRIFSGRESLGGASFFRTTKRDGKLIGSFLTSTPDEFKAAIEKAANFKLISIEKITPENFISHEASPQESL